MLLASSVPVLPVAIAIAFLVLVFGLQIYLEQRAGMAREALRTTGTPVLGVLVMANAEFLASQAIPQAPALVAFSFDPPSPELADALRDLGRRAFALYTSTRSTGGLGAADRAVSKFMKSDSYRADRRERVPDEFSGGREVYLAHVLLTRLELPPDLASHRVLPCAVSGREKGSIVPLGPGDAATSTILDQAGA